MCQGSLRLPSASAVFNAASNESAVTGIGSLCMVSPSAVAASATCINCLPLTSPIPMPASVVGSQPVVDRMSSGQPSTHEAQSA
jgi:hypothetical protein